MWAYLRIMKEKRRFHHPSETTKRRWLGYSISILDIRRDNCQVSNICLEVLQKQLYAQRRVVLLQSTNYCIVWWRQCQVTKDRAHVFTDRSLSDECWSGANPAHNPGWKFFLTKYGKPKSQSPSQMLSYMNASGEQICFMSMAACLSLIPPISSTWCRPKCHSRKSQVPIVKLDNDALTSLLHCYYLAFLFKV